MSALQKMALMQITEVKGHQVHFRIWNIILMRRNNFAVIFLIDSGLKKPHNGFRMLTR